MPKQRLDIPKIASNPIEAANVGSGVPKNNVFEIENGLVHPKRKLLLRKQFGRLKES